MTITTFCADFDCLETFLAGGSGGTAHDQRRRLKLVVSPVSCVFVCLSVGLSLNYIYQVTLIVAFIIHMKSMTDQFSEENLSNF